MRRSLGGGQTFPDELGDHWHQRAGGPLAADLMVLSGRARACVSGECAREEDFLTSTGARASGEVSTHQTTCKWKKQKYTNPLEDRLPPIILFCPAHC